jgi:hypothetical protein
MEKCHASQQLRLLDLFQTKIVFLWKLHLLFPEEKDPLLLSHARTEEI